MEVECTGPLLMCNFVPESGESIEIGNNNNRNFVGYLSGE